MCFFYISQRIKLQKQGKLKKAATSAGKENSKKSIQKLKNFSYLFPRLRIISSDVVNTCIKKWWPVSIFRHIMVYPYCSIISVIINICYQKKKKKGFPHENKEFNLLKSILHRWYILQSVYIARAKLAIFLYDLYCQKRHKIDLIWLCLMHLKILYLLPFSVSIIQRNIAFQVERRERSCRVNKSIKVYSRKDDGHSSQLNIFKTGIACHRAKEGYHQLSLCSYKDLEKWSFHPLSFSPDQYSVI